MTKTPKKLKFLTVTLIALLLTGCAQTGSRSAMDINDPFEKMNRKVFAFNVTADKYVFHPITDGYRFIAPKLVRTGIANVIRNLRSPVDFSNQLLQGDIKGAGTIFTRAAINSTIGLGGLIDIAAKEGIPYESEDFGQTLAVWGVPHGPYFMLPLMGPSSLRDYAASFADGYLDPYRAYMFNTEREGIYYTTTALNILGIRDSFLDAQRDLETNSADYYAAVRSIYYQRRAMMTKDLDPKTNTAAFDFPDYEDDDLSEYE